MEHPLTGEWFASSVLIIVVMALAGVPVVSIGIYVITRTLRGDAERHRLT